jgi:hypothetical protein
MPKLLGLVLIAAGIAFAVSRPRVRAAARKHLVTGRQALFGAAGPIRHIKLGLKRKAA